jgi:hypothetical protein
MISKGQKIQEAERAVLCSCCSGYLLAPIQGTVIDTPVAMLPSDLHQRNPCCFNCFYFPHGLAIKKKLLAVRLPVLQNMHPVDHHINRYSLPLIL